MTDAPSARTTVRRKAERGRYDAATVHAILDEALVCHVGFVDDDQPFVLPTIHVRVGDRLYLHGSPASRMLRAVRAGTPLCVTVTLIDALVLARSAFHHSMNYRSVVLLGTGQEVDDEPTKLRVFEAVVEHLAPGRWSETRSPSTKELRATSVVAIPLDEASAKVRTGPPVEEEEDYALAYWAGELPLRLVADAPIADFRLHPDAVVGRAVSGWSGAAAAT